MKIPYHGLQVCGDVLLAARGCNIHTFSLRDGAHLSTWICPSSKGGEELLDVSTGQIRGSSESTPVPPEALAEEGGDPTPPTKRRRVESDDEDGKDEQEKREGQEEEETAVQPEGESKRIGKKTKKRGRKRRSRPLQPPKPAEQPLIQCLTPTVDGKYVVAVTGLDKTIWVLEHDGIGHLKQLSRRTMPKRPSSITFTLDNRTILSADKFGDVFSLPLLPDEEVGGETSFSTPSTPATPGTPSAPQAFKPQANLLTVHTKRNLRALQNQKFRTQTTEKPAMAFEHALLLGHVSMLTAIALGFREDGKGGKKEYIITGDRDEHIRVSRGVGQAHIIESFCLGHHEFVSRLCIPPGHPEVLISAGGDDDLFVWDWLHGRLLLTVDLLSCVQGVIPEASQTAVSGLRAFHHSSRVGPSEGGEEGTKGTTWVVVICEAVPALFCFRLVGHTLSHVQTDRLPANPLDLIPVDTQTDSPQLIVAMDNSPNGHPESDGQEDGEKESPASPSYPSLIKYGWDGDSGWRQTPFEVQDGTPGNGEADITKDELKKSLYTVEPLRKTDYDDD